MTNELEIISCFFNKKCYIAVYRNRNGKYFIRIDGVFTEKRLTSIEVVKYLSNIANEQII